ncbi:hypothetical protein [Streptomyces erythrochromogenes]|uniref:hypothetical protein n=1 Tax=Streptomyces erythrochromogenes TaxID=285574 RepID=UPI0036BF195F
MGGRFERFVGTYLHLVEGYDTSGYLGPTLLGFKEPFVEAVRSGFAQALADDSFGPSEYGRPADIQFPGQETLNVLDDLVPLLEEIRRPRFSDAEPAREFIGEWVKVLRRIVGNGCLVRRSG